LEKWKDGWMDGWMDVWMDNGWTMDGRIDDGGMKDG
jgi:hypothetical protein